MQVCHFCGTELLDIDRYCTGCGLSTGLSGTIIGSYPAVATGMVVGLVGLIAGRIIPIPQGQGFFVDILRFVLGTTVPFFDVAFGFFGGMAASIALYNRNYRYSLASGFLVGVLYACTVVAISIVFDYNILWSRIAISAGLSLSAATLISISSLKLGKCDNVINTFSIIPYARYFIIAFTSLAAIFAFLVIYYVIAIIVATIIVLVIFIVITCGVLLAIYLLTGWKPPLPFWKGRLSLPSGSSPNKPGRSLDTNDEMYDDNDYEDNFTNMALNVVDGNGVIKGVVDSQGHFWYPKGTYFGQIMNNGRILTKTGTYKGKVDGNGKIWSAKKKLLGTLK